MKKMETAKKIAIILFGNLMYAVAIAYFILPGNLITGGTTGLGIFLEHYMGLSITVFAYIFNIAMFITGAVILGKSFAMTTFISTIAYPVFLSVLQQLVKHTGYITDDPMLNTVCAGLLVGVGIGLILKEGASSGGMDIPPLVINKYTGASVAFWMYAFDVMILVIQALFSDKEQITYGILMVCIYSYALEKFLVLGKKSARIEIIGEKHEQILQVILEKFDRGATLYEVEGGYTRKEMYAVVSVVNNRELFRISEMVKEIDPNAFIIIDEVKEVRGRGFTKEKKYVKIVEKND